MVKNKLQIELQNTRQSNVEALRIIAMLMIVAHHFVVHSGFIFPDGAITINRLWLKLISIGGKIGVDVFVLISGYFLVSAHSFKTEKAIKLWVEIWLYSVAIYLAFTVTGKIPFSINTFIKAVAPITFNEWWFARAYFILYLLTPFINRMLNAFDKNLYLRFLLLVFIIWSVLPVFTQQSFLSNDLIWFITIYALGGYIRLHLTRINQEGVKLLGIAAICIVMTFLLSGMFDVIGLRNAFMAHYSTILYEMYSPLILGIAVLIFAGFLNLDLGSNRIINAISSATFGVYLLHDSNYVRPFLWRTILHSASYAQSKALIPYSLLVIVAVFIICTLIELGRIHIIEKSLMPVISKVSLLIDSFKVRLISKLMNSI